MPPFLRYVPAALLILLLTAAAANVSSATLLPDFLYLVTNLKNTISDPTSALSSWNASSTSPCFSWAGVSCDPADHSNTTVTSLDLSGLDLAAPFPSDICLRLPRLSFLSLSNNSFYSPADDSTLSSALAGCSRLVHLDLSQNLFTGSLPESVASLPLLTFLDLSGNNFSGDFPESYGRFPRLLLLSVAYNLLDGKIPRFLGNVNTLKVLNLSYNPFVSGSFPDELGNLTNLEILWMKECGLVGEIPAGVWGFPSIPKGMGGLKKLKELNLAHNGISGAIPGELGNLPVLNYLDLSENKFSGSVPDELQNLKLNQLNMSFNLLSGALPPMFSAEMYRNSFLGNPGLCRDLRDLCSDRSRMRSSVYAWMLRVIFILTGLVLILGGGWFYIKYMEFKEGKKAVDKTKWTMMSFHKLGFSVDEILDCLDEDNVIASGSSGKVYKVLVSSGEAVAVKKLWRSGKKKDFDGYGDIEAGNYDTIGKIRHKNIVKRCCCCVIKDCKLLVYKYMPNGSLGDLLHSRKGGLLNWSTRYRIAVDAAEGLSYLHHDYVPPIVHWDVKSNNILLDAEFGARVAAFGVAKVARSTSAKGHESMSVIAGSCGYIAPEYAYTPRVNEKSDIYSFSAVPLELVTGKRPVDPEFGGKDLVKWACVTLDQKGGVDSVIDPKLDSCFKEEVCKVLNIGLQCTSPSAVDAEEISAENAAKRSGKDGGRLTPYYYDDASDLGSAA